MREAKLIDAYISRLREDPSAAPPSGLDPELASTVREVVLAARDPAPPLAIEARVWTQVLHAVQPSASPWRSTNNNGKGNTASLVHKEDRTMTALSRPLSRTRPVHRPAWTLLAAALAAIIFFGGMLPYLLNNLSPNGPQAVWISSEDANKEVFLRYISEAWNLGDTAVLNELLAQEHVCYEPGIVEPITGIKHVADMISNYRTAFPDWTFTVEDITATEDEVRARLVGIGTHNGPFVWADGVTIEPTGNPITLDVVLDARFLDGQIAEQWFQIDTSELLRQLSPGKAPEAYLIEQRNLATTQRVTEGLFVTGNLDVIDEAVMNVSQWCQPNHTCRPTTNATRRGWFEYFRAAFPDMEVTITPIAATGDTVVSEIEGKGTFSDIFNDMMTTRTIQPTHKTVTFSVVTILRFNSEGVLTSDRWYWNYLGWPYAPPAGDYAQD